MQYEKPDKNDSSEISKLSEKETGWTSSKEHLQRMLEKYPASVAVEDEEICGFIYSQALSSDILRICNFVVDGEKQKQGIGSHLLRDLEKQAGQSGYKAILFPEDDSWWSKDSLDWLDDQGFRNIYETDRSSLAIKEVEEVPV
jgi:N-acetylglutamate synthase-like GNAT family acetyltransferase